MIISLFISVAKAETLKVAVLDTGLSKVQLIKKEKLCNNSFVDLTGFGVLDIVNHGNKIIDIIKHYAEDSSYCIIPIKWFHQLGFNSADSLARAIDIAVEEKVNIINISAAGKEEVVEETIAIKKALKNNIIVVVSAGNEGYNTCIKKEYPAGADDLVTVVGAGKNEKNRTIYSNYGCIVDAWEENDQIVPLHGTSAAAAVYTGKLIRRLTHANPKYSSTDTIDLNFLQPKQEREKEFKVYLRKN